MIDRAAELLAPPRWGGERAEVLLSRVDTESGVRRLKAAVWVLLALGVLGFLVQGANRPPDPVLSRQLLTPVPAAPASAHAHAAPASGAHHP